MSRNVKRAGLVLIPVVALMLFLAYFYSPFAKQAKAERKIVNEYSKIQLPAGLEFQARNDFGDVILGSESDWGIQYVYKFSTDFDSMVEGLKGSLTQASYSVNVEKCTTCKIATTITGENPQAQVKLKANITDYTMPPGSYLVTIEVRNI